MNNAGVLHKQTLDKMTEVRYANQKIGFGLEKVYIFRKLYHLQILQYTHPQLLLTPHLFLLHQFLATHNYFPNTFPIFIAPQFQAGNFILIFAIFLR